MASRMGLFGCLIVVATLVMGATADTYSVGNELGWNIPPGGAIAYRTWARTEDFQFGDILFFNWTGTHDVARVSRTDYDNCTTSNPIGTVQTTSPANYTINTNETLYFICTVNNHCDLGQKVAIAIGSATSILTTSVLSAIVLAMAISFSSIM